MEHFWQLINQEIIKDSLDTARPEVRRAGEFIYANGNVSALSIEENLYGYSCKSVVRDMLMAFHVQCQFERDHSFTAGCACIKRIKCEHVYAVLKTIFVELNYRRVQQLSSGAMFMGDSPSHSDASHYQSFTHFAEASLKVKLNGQEQKFAQMIDEIFYQAWRSKKFDSIPYHPIGLYFAQEARQMIVDLVPTAKSIDELWHCVAAAMEYGQLTIPIFLRPITREETLKEITRQWLRKKEIQQWEKRIQSSISSFKRHVPIKQHIELRFRARQDGLDIEYKDSLSADFKNVTQTQLKRLYFEVCSGQSVLSSKAHAIWVLLSPEMEDDFYETEIDLSSDRMGNEDHITKLLFYQPEFEELIVNVFGQPFKRSELSLSWKISPTLTSEGNYQIFLTLPSGDRPPRALFIVDGHPPLYVTDDTIYAAPESIFLPEMDPVERLIPAPVMETQAGIRFLEYHDVPIPKQIEDRILRLPLKISLHAKLGFDPHRKTQEYCLIDLAARSEDGQIFEVWNGNDWRPSKKIRPRISNQTNTMIRYYDRSIQEKMTDLIRLLDLRFEHAFQSYGMKVTRKFPQQFSSWLKNVPPEVQLNLEGDLASLVSGSLCGKVKLEATEIDIDWFDLKVVLDVSDTTLTDKELKMLLDAKGQFIRLPGKGWRRLEFNLSEEEDQQLAQLGMTPHDLSSEPQRLHALQLASPAARKFLPEEQAQKIQVRADEIKTRVMPPVSSDLKAELRPYQIEGYHFLAYLATNRFGGILADDMGLGKTLQALAWILWLQEQSTDVANQRFLVICPKSVMDNWRAEAERFAPKLKVKVWTASLLADFLKHLDEADLHVINYSQLRMIEDCLASVHWLAVVMDEGQYIKNPNSLTAQAARSLQASHRLVLTGTPIENRLMDLWSLMAFVMPGALGNRYSFGRIYDSKTDPLARRRLSARVRPFLLRRTKTQVAKDLPEKIEEDLYCEIEGEQLTLYRAELKFAQQLLLKVKTQKELAQFQFNFLASMLRLRQICCHPALVKPNVKGESAKLNALIDLLEPLIEEGHKVLVFSQFVTMLERIRNVIENNEWSLFYLTGETENRGELVSKFQNTKGAAVFLISLKAGGFGLNLTAANYVVLFDPWWNPAVETQAIDRTHRIGQTNTVIAYRLLIKNSIEEKIRILQRHKAQMADDVLGEEKFAQSLTLDDLRYLFAE